ncbi:hypothetical protein F4778DRAFT_783246 [Xylariomycetidae sp. FL2044]|nr:hypothetical protein F4778DRAFT_783246 [Xylariomycetidae sp. FL2044]
MVRQAEGMAYVSGLIQYYSGVSRILSRDADGSFDIGHMGSAVTELADLMVDYLPYPKCPLDPAKFHLGFWQQCIWCRRGPSRPLETADRTLKVQREQRHHVLSREEGECLQAFDTVPYEEYKDTVKEAVEVSAGPGCGKTTLTKHIIDQVCLGSPDYKMCYFFFNADGMDQLCFAFSSILHQLTTANPWMIKYSMQPFKENRTGLRTLTNMMWEIITHILDDPESANVVFIIDALDECVEKDLHTLFRPILNLFTDTQQPRRIRFLLTGRPVAIVESGFSNLIHTTRSAIILGENNSEEISAAASRVIQCRVEELRRDKILSRGMETRLKSGLNGFPHRTYLWLHLVMDYLRNDVKHGVQLDAREIDAASLKLPRKAEDTYALLLSRSDNQIAARNIFSVMLAAERALTIAELKAAVCINGNVRSLEELDLESDKNFTARVMQWCGLLVSIIGGIVYFLHDTVREFPLSDSQDVKEPNGWKHSISLAEAHGVMHLSCVQYLSLDDIKSHAVAIKERIESTPEPILPFLPHPDEDLRSLSSGQDST